MYLGLARFIYKSQFVTKKKECLVPNSSSRPFFHRSSVLVHLSSRYVSLFASLSYNLCNVIDELNGE